MKFNFLEKLKKRFSKPPEPESRKDVGKQWVVRTGKNRAMRRAEAKRARRGKRKRGLAPASFYTHRIVDGERVVHTPDTTPMTTEMVGLILATRRLARKRQREARDGQVREVQAGVDGAQGGPLLDLSQDVHDSPQLRPPPWKFWM